MNKRKTTPVTKKTGKISYGTSHPEVVRAKAVRLFYEEGQTETEVMQTLQTDGIACEESDIRNWARTARKNREIRYVASTNVELADFIRRRNRHLQQADVVVTSSAKDVADRGADMLLDMLRSHGPRNSIRIGLAGGRTPSLLAAALATKMSEHPDELRELPHSITFHSLVGILDQADPGVDPNTYPLHFFHAIDKVRERLHFLSFPAPGVVHRDERKLIDEIQAVKRARNYELNIIVTSCGHASSNHEFHNSFWDHIAQCCPDNPRNNPIAVGWTNTQKFLRDNKVLGDIAWQPVNHEGIIKLDEENLEAWATTLFNRQNLLRFGETGGKVLLLAAPCSGPTCKESKGELLAGILREPDLVSHLVVDLQSAVDYKQLKLAEERVMRP